MKRSKTNLNNSDMETDEALEKMKRYCDYQDRCHSEVRTKLIKIKVYGDRLEEVISILVSEGYLNEQRYAMSYARGKHRINLWGREKIKKRLIFKKVSNYCIQKAMASLDESEYLENLGKVLQKCVSQARDGEKFHVVKSRCISRALSRGYEYPLILKVLDSSEDWTGGRG